MKKGQPFSVRAGLCDAPFAGQLLVGLGDQPLLTSDDLHALVSAHLVGDAARISIPHNRAQRGSPIVVPAQLRGRLQKDAAHPGCAKFTRANPDLVQHISLSQPGFCSDIDTPADFAAFRKSATERSSA